MSVFESIKKFVAGDVAHNVTDAGNPVKIGGKAAATVPTAVADGRRVDAFFDTNGRQVVATGAVDSLPIPSPTPLFILGGAYQATVPTLDAGDVGYLRITERRGIMTAADFAYMSANHTTVAEADDMEVSTTAGGASGYATPTTAFFDGSDAGFTADPRYIRIPMKNWHTMTFHTFQNLGVAMTVELSLWMNGGADSNEIIKIDSVSVPNSSKLIFGALANGAAGSTEYRQVEALNMPAAYVQIKITPDSSPAAGAIRVRVTRGS